jgi:hypothetical protein
MIYFLIQILICMAMFSFDGQVLFIYLHHEVTVLFTTVFFFQTDRIFTLWPNISIVVSREKEQKRVNGK